MSGAATPLMQQYREIKSRHQDAILFFRMGDFYEMFYDDAETASRAIGLTLTSRNNGGAAEVPLAGIPVKAAADGGYADYGFSHGGDYYNTGRLGDFYGEGYPEQVVVDEAFLRLGKERYDINCAVCHGRSGNGLGVTSKFGVPNIANFHTPPFLDAKDPAYRANGSIFETISKGKGLMGSYGANIPVMERWAIVAWVRTLQMSRSAPLADPAVKAAWDKLNPAPVTAAK